MSAKSNRKGKTGERELARKLRSLSPALFGDSRRNFGQSRKRGEVPDLEVHDNLWPECKRMRRCSPAAALRQAIEETRMADSDRVPIAFCRDDDGEWTVTLRLTDWVPMFEDSHDLRSVCVTSARAAELEAETACKALREATGRLEPQLPCPAPEVFFNTPTVKELEEWDVGPALATRMAAVKAQHERPDTTWHSFDEYVAEATARLEPCGYASKRDEWNDKALSGLAPPAMQAAALSRLIENDPSIFTADDLEECKRRIKRHREQRPDLFDRGAEAAAEEMRVVSVSTRKPSSPE